MLKTKLFNAKKQLDELRSILRTIKPLTKITEADVALALDDLDKKKQQSRPIKEAYRQEIEKFNVEQKDKERELETVSKRYNIPLGLELDEWAKEPKHTANGYLALAQIGMLNDDALVIKRKKELLAAQLALEEEKLRDETLRIDVKDSFYKMTNSLLNTEEKLRAELKKYHLQKDEIKTNVAVYKERQNAIASLIMAQKKALENLVLKQQAAEQEKNGVFKDASMEYEQYIALFKHAQAKVQEQLDLLGKIAGLYTEILSKMNNADKHIDFIVAELESRSPWGRLEHAISWDGLKNSVPDVQSFIKDVHHYITNVEISSLWQKFKGLFRSPWQVILFFLKLLLALFILLVVKMYLPYITDKLISVEQAPIGVRWVSILLAVFLGFAVKYLVSIVIWVTCFIVLLANYCVDPHPLIMFYLLSIPFLLYLANRWMKYLVYFNEKYDY